MQNQLSQKERLLLEDLKSQEEICVTKYQSYAQLAQDPQLSQLFTILSSEEQKHYNTVNQILQGQQPAAGQGQSGQTGGQMGQQGMQTTQTGSQAGQQNMQTARPWNITRQESMQSSRTGSQMSGSKNDKFLCTDLLSTEKYVSGTYDTCIFESPNPSIRQALQHIQKDEQHHGEQIFNYMNSHGMYQVQ